MSKGQSQPRTHSGRRTLGQRKNKAIESIEIIDVDNGKADVVIIDAPESFHQGSGCSRGRSSSRPAFVIRIDDEEGDIDDTLSNAGQSSSSNRACPVYCNRSLHRESDNDESLMFLRRGHSPSNLSGKARRHPASGSISHYGLYSSSDSSASESDSSECDTSENDSCDCEIMEDFSGVIREQWERAALKRKLSPSVQEGSEDQANAPGSSADPGLPSAKPTGSIVDLEDCVKDNHKTCSEHLEGLLYECGPSSSNNGMNFTYNMNNVNELNGDFFLVINRKDSPADSDTSTGVSCAGPCFEKEKSISESSLPGAQFFETHIDLNEASPPDIQMQGNTNSSVDGFNYAEKAEKVPPGNSFSTDVHRVETNFHGEEGTRREQPPEAWDGKHLFSDSVGLHNKKEDVLYTQSPHNSPVDHEVTAEAKEKSFMEQMPPFNEPLHHEPQIKHGSDCFRYDNEAIHGESTCKNNAGTAASKRSFSLYPDIQDLSESKSVVVVDLEKHNLYLINQNVSHVQNDETGDSEKHKESDEYKHVKEEEWASRKRELQIQAEEALRLRKKKKAEILHLLDMEKRQKQRVEEIRESQRKEEEIIHLKEHFRAEIRKELDKVEGRYKDLASLLRGLGIHVEGGLFPLSHEVNAAYKQALLRFHPDRASRTDIRQQVEAEETFKMISRLKEKLLPVA